MNLLIISASQRYPSQSRKVADYLKQTVEKNKFFDTVQLIDLGQNPLPLWDQGVWDGTPEWKHMLNPVIEQMRKADAFILVIPEWNGMATPAIKNLTLFAGEHITGHKPVLLVSVSAGISGQYPISDLRVSGYKNTKWVYIPDHLIVRFVNSVMNGDKPENDNDALIRERAEYSLKQLKLYAEALQSIRNKLEFDERFKYAM